MKHSQARIYAEGVLDQNKERLADELAQLLADSPDFFATLDRMVHMNAQDATRVLLRMPKAQQKVAIQWLIPCARVGLSVATFAMEDKYMDPEGNEQ